MCGGSALSFSIASSNCALKAISVKLTFRFEVQYLLRLCYVVKSPFSMKMAFSVNLP